MLVRELMTTGVLSVSPTVPVKALVALLAERALPGVPVIDAANRLVGMVTESDLLRRLALSDEPQLTWFQSLFDNHDRAADRYARAHGVTAGDVMTRALWTVDENTTAERAARMLEEHKIRRLPVLREGQLVGMVSRTDLLRALFPSPANGITFATSDDSIRSAILASMRQQPWATAPLLSFEVGGGVVELRGYHRSEATRRALSVLIWEVPGVTRVLDNATEMPPNSMSA
ncbi:MAG TPA: CBS domain-containing protein [Geminicoccus sp.]|uniref:CBS domain-containing protein n=1 Tax=Geminicoccus sp. TaxID=2024832 RepID=UPI002C583FCF|nr:CBS domain-containing protein [Geminicoccus sp.]HWL69286.1 CBS domain-containing protein [Geminicoccus sp.]